MGKILVSPTCLWLLLQCSHEGSCYGGAFFPYGLANTWRTLLQAHAASLKCSFWASAVRLSVPGLSMNRLYLGHIQVYSHSFLELKNALGNTGKAFIWGRSMPAGHQMSEGASITAHLASDEAYT